MTSTPRTEQRPTEKAINGNFEGKYSTTKTYH